MADEVLHSNRFKRMLIDKVNNGPHSRHCGSTKSESLSHPSLLAGFRGGLRRKYKKIMGWTHNSIAKTVIYVTVFPNTIHHPINA